MPTTQLQLRRGNTAQTAIFTGAVGEVTVDTQKKTLIVHDGVTAGGTEIALKSYANAAYHAANNAGSTASDAYQHAGSASSYANGAFAAANTVASNLSSANTWLQTYVGTQISNLVDSAPTTLDTLNELAAALGDDANFSTTISNMVGVSGGYANSAYLKANAAYHAANNAGSTASDAYQHAGSASSYANSAFSKANTATILAQAAFNAANTGGGGGGGGAALANGTQTFSLTESGDTVFSGETGGVNRGLVWDYGAEAGGENSTVRQDVAGLSVRAWTEVLENEELYSAPVNIVTNQDVNEKRWTFNGSGDLDLPAGGTISEGLVTSNPTIQLTPATPDVASQKLVIKGGLPPEEPTDYHLHLTTGDLTETSIFLGTDNHNVRTTTNGNIQITTPNTVNKVWEFGTNGGLRFPDGTQQYTAYTGGGNNPGTSINLDFGTFNTPAEFDINLGTF
jgi:Major tropism determinant N-terminal domain